MKTRKLSLVILSSVFVGGMLLTCINNNTFTQTNASVHGSSCSWNHYNEVSPTYTNPGVREYWICCNHSDLGPSFAAPTVGSIREATHSSGFVNTLETTDNRYLLPYSEPISFEDGFVPSIFTKQQKISTMEVVSDGTDGAAALKVTVSGSDYRIGISKNYLDEVFSDPSVVEINFDCKSNVVTSNFRYGTTANHPTYEVNLNGYGLETGFKTFTFKRSYYEAYEEGYSFIYGGGLSSGDYLIIDNIRPVTKALTSYGFENGRIVDPSISGYENKLSYRQYDANKEVFVTSSSSVTSSFGFDYSKKTEGNRSLRVTKTNGYMSFHMPNLYSNLASNALVSFDMYSTVGINIATTANFLDGKNNKSFIADSHPANQWVTYTFTKDQMTTDGRFLIIQGSTGGDFFFDNIRFSTYENGAEVSRNIGDHIIADTTKSSIFSLSHSGDTIISTMLDDTNISFNSKLVDGGISIKNSALTAGNHNIVVTYRSGNVVYKETITLNVVIATLASTINVSTSYMSTGYYILTGYSDVYRMTCQGQEIPFEESGSNYLIPEATLVQFCSESNGKKVSSTVEIQLITLDSITIQPFNVTLSAEAAPKTLPTFNGKGIDTHAYSSTSSYANRTNYETYFNIEKLQEYADTGLDIIYEQAVHVSVNDTSLCAALRYELDNAGIIGKKVMLSDDALAQLSRQTISLVGNDLTLNGVSKHFNTQSELDSYVRSRLEIYINEPNCYGVSVGDEQSYLMLCNGFGEVLQSIHRVLNDMGRNDFYVNTNLNPMNASFEMLAGDKQTGNPIEDYVTYLEKYVEVSGNDYIQYDIYPIMDLERTLGGAFYDSDGNLTSEGYGLHNFGLKQLMLTTYMCKKYDLDLYVVSQTITYYGTRILNATDISWLNNMIMGFGVRHLSWFVYQVRANTGSEVWQDDGSFLGKEGNKNPIYYYMQGMIAQINNFENIITNFTYEWSRLYKGSSYSNAWFYGAVLDSSFKNYYSTSDSYGQINSVSVDNEYVLATGLKDSSGRYMYMIQNAHNHPTTKMVQSITVTCNSTYSYALVYEAGSPRIVSLGTTGVLSWKKSTLSLQLSSGRAAYVMFF